MCTKLPVWTLSLGLFLAVAPFSLSAQQGTLTGTVRDEASGSLLTGRDVQIRGGGETRIVQTNNQGQYSVELPAGTYDLAMVLVLGYDDRSFQNVRVPAGETTTFDLQLLPQAILLDGLTITGDRKPLGEPVVRPAQGVMILRNIVSSPNPSDALVAVGPVSVITAGLQSSHPVVRGFNNVFSGALHMLTDYRLAGVPSLRVNLLHFIPSIAEDIDRIEVVLGPSSALYGPNTANGIIHMITKSPLESQGTSVTLGGGGRSLFEGGLRSAFLINENFGFKISGKYMRGDEWDYEDPAEQAGREFADANPDACLNDKAVRGLDPADAQTACARIGVRDFDVERWGLEARADYRFADDGIVVGTYGRNNSSGIELTGLGAGQTSNWVYEFFQARVRKGRFFSQAYYNTSDAGDSFLLGDGVPLVDQSSLFVGQVQQGFVLADGRQEFTVGADYFATRPDSRGTIYGSYEDDDDINEWGGYLLSRTGINDQLDLVLAGRLDKNSVLPNSVFSSRVALVYAPQEGHNIRLSYNRAFSTPSSLNYFLDISGGVARGAIGPLGYTGRAYGSGRNGWSLQNPDGTLRGMRSPFNPDGAGQLLEADVDVMWPLAIGVLESQGVIDSGTAALLVSLAPTNSDIAREQLDVNTGLRETVGTPGAVLPDLPPIRESYTETFELGWSGLVADDRLSITADVYYMKKNDFVSPLVVETPLLFLNEGEIVTFLTPFVGAPTAAALGAGIAMLPIGVVSSDQVGAQAADLIASYRNVGDIDLWGADIAFSLRITNRWDVGGSYSHMSEDYFEITGGSPIALNAPKDKGSLSLNFHDVVSGLNASGRVRYTSGFPAQSADFRGTACIPVPEGEPRPLFEENCVDKFAIFDLNAGYAVPNTAATVQLSINNVFNTGYRSFPGVPKIGRLAIIRVKYDIL